jgi:hypothetical protein
MTRPTIQLPKGYVRPKTETTEAGKTEPVGLPKPKVHPKPTDFSLLNAQTAVEEYEIQRRVLDEMREDWESNFPEASLARNSVLQQEDLVREAIAKAHALVAIAKKTVGDFVATPKWSKPHYDEAEVTRILSSLSNRLEVFEKMIDSGIVDAISLKKEAALAWFAQHPDLANSFQSAFKDREEKTCAVSTPKI